MTDVLVVDDDRSMREILELALEALGYEVATVADALQKPISLATLRDVMTRYVSASPAS